jgi:hypothetical protein
MKTKRNRIFCSIFILFLCLILFIIGSCDGGVKLDIKITQYPKKTNYLMGEQIDLEGLVVSNIYKNGDTEITTDYHISGDTFTAGSASITVISNIDKGATASFKITVADKLINTGLPVIYIKTKDAEPIISKEDYVNGTLVIKQNNIIIHENTMRIKGRGHATWKDYPKKPYKIKLDDKANFFEMGSDKDWVLLANYCDKTLLRTGIAFELSRLMNFPWTPDAQFVEVVLNGHYLGNYQLVEGVKKDSLRVNVSNSGYIIERDDYYLEEPKYFVTKSGYGYSFKYPDTDDLTNTQLNYIHSYMNEFEAVLSSNNFSNPSTGYQKYIDIDSFVRWFLFQNIIANIDTNRYLTKADDKSSKINIGPVWDFEWSMGIGWYDGSRPRPSNYWVNNNDWYYRRLLQDSAFKSKLKTLWNEKNVALQKGVLDYISAARTEISISQELNFRRWDILNTQISAGGIPLGSFEAEVECDKQFFTNHMKWLDKAINEL